MSTFDSFNTDGMETPVDSLGGFSIIGSDTYAAEIKAIYITKSKGGAMAANLVASVNGRDYRERLWITNAKGENFYLNKKTGGKVPLPGFTVLNDICICALGKELRSLDAEPKVFNIYDVAAKKEVPTEVPTITALMGESVTLGIIHQKVNKQAQNAKGDYVDTPEIRDENVIDKVFSADDMRTSNEIKSEKESAEFYDKWKAKNSGVTRDRTKKVAAGMANGATAQPEVKSLFA